MSATSPSAPATSRANVVAFLAALWGEGLHSLCAESPGADFRAHGVFATPDELLQRAIRLGPGRSVWFGRNAMAERPALRGGDADVTSVQSLSADLDWLHPAHKATDLPTEAEVRLRLRGLGPELQPSVVVNTGHGLQPWWLLDHPLDADDGADLQAALDAKLLELDLRNERLDLASVMRLPGTINARHAPNVAVRFERFELGVTYVPEYLAKRLPAAHRRRSAGTRHQGGGAITETQQAMLEHLVEHHGAHSPITVLGMIHITRPGKPAADGSSASIIIGTAGDALLTVFSPSWAAIGPLAGEASASWVLVEGELRRAYLEDPMLAELSADDDEAPPAPSSYDPVDLGPYLRGEIVTIDPTLAVMSDGRGLLYAGRLNGVHGDSGAGKSWMLAYVVAEEAAAGRAVMVVDLEDDAGPLIQRLRQLGVSDDDIASLVVFVHPGDPFTKGNVERLMAAIRDHHVGHVFIDSLGEAFALDGIDENTDAEVAPWLARVVRRIIDQTGAGVTLLDHITKAADNPLHPSGSKRKRAAITGASWLAVAVEAFSLEQGGRMLLRCGKDRHGHYRRGSSIAQLIMAPYDITTGMTTMTLLPVAPDEATEERRLDLVAAVVNALERYGADGLPTKAVGVELRRVGVKFRNSDLLGALDLAVARGFLISRSGPRGKVEYVFVRRVPWDDE